MMFIPLWKRVLVVVTVILSFAYCLPNFVSSGTRDAWEKSLPSWMPTKSMSLGLDLQGGSHLLLQADIDSVIKKRVEDVEAFARTKIKAGEIGYQSIGSVSNGVRVELKSEDSVSDLRKIFREADDQLAVDSEGSVVTAVFDEAGIKDITDKTIAQSIEVVSRRVNGTGTKEPIIQRQGDDRILVQLPGMNDPKRVKELLDKTAQLSFHLVSMTGEGLNIMTLPMHGEVGQTLPINRRPLLTGDMLVNATPTFQDGAPIVSFRLNTAGAKKFCDVTRDNVDKPFAVVLDKEIITAPRINEAICTGSAVISGNFTVQEASDLALLLRAGALPTSLSIVEERTVGPSLGSDSVEAGKIATMVAFLLIIAYMMMSYRLFGVFASVALFINMVLIIALLSMLQATLTLPGIAGIVLTMGMAVDANVLIFERIREEIRSGRSIISAMDTGYEKAMASIIDSNLTTLISGIILYAVGTGPIKGFAVTMSIGIATSLFSAIMLTRLMLVVWLRVTKPKTLPL
ncbi:MAG: protein translocase subunit SecD [Alphaproteobacteria bacterium]|jgi:preprotein translocase subunit SecD|nr:protein translocase subunit SecD [Alphaproteobacteria bacterium]MCB1551495.1 protein translocase subunit SecD [Alphaproteobacteria bacterium]MCB9985062.1 protein translocase subunit SecD [Micavibrio sp.]